MQNQIEGRRAVYEALRAGSPIDKLYIQKTAKGLGEIRSLAYSRKGVIVDCDKEYLDRVSQTGTHQGVVAKIAAFEYSEISDFLTSPLPQDLFLVVCDGIQDEGNLGAIIRTAEIVGASAIVIPKRRSATLSAATFRASAGAAGILPICRVPGIPAFLRQIKDLGVWIYGAAGESTENAFDTIYNSPKALVLGGEENGLSRLSREYCDKLISLPMRGKTASLNVSCAAAVLMYRMKT